MFSESGWQLTHRYTFNISNKFWGSYVCTKSSSPPFLPFSPFFSSLFLSFPFSLFLPPFLLPFLFSFSLFFLPFSLPFPLFSFLSPFFPFPIFALLPDFWCPGGQSAPLPPIGYAPGYNALVQKSKESYKSHLCRWFKASWSKQSVSLILKLKARF